MCTYKYMFKKLVSGVVGTATGMVVGRLNKVAGVAAGAVATVTTDIGLDYLEAKIELDKIRKESEERVSAVTPDDFNYDDTDVVGETTTVETTTVETNAEEKPEEKKEVKKPLSPLEEDKEKAKELDLKELDDEKEESPKGDPANRRLNPTTRK